MLKRIKEVLQKKSFYLLILFLLQFTFIITWAQEPTPKSDLKIVQCIAGICVGLKPSVDREVKQKYGDGLFDPSVPHLGARYYIHPKKLYTLYVVISVDEVIDTVELTKGVEIPPQFKNELKKAINKKLPFTPAIDFDLKLGMSPAELLKKLGKPTMDKKEGKKRMIKYQTTVETDPRVALGYGAQYTFIADRLVQISLYDGE
jgi:hypothetical protein